MSETFDTLKTQISDLDLIFFRGYDLVSKTIMEAEKLWLGDGNWSHVGLVISKRSLSTLNSNDPIDTLYVWESTMSSTDKLITADPTVDIESGKGVFGVQIRKLEDVIQNTLKEGAGVGWSKLVNNPLKQRTEESDDDYTVRKAHIYEKLNELHEKYYHKPYPLNVFRIARGLFTCCICINPVGTRKAVFCSEFVAIVYEALGIISRRFTPGEVIPVELENPELAEKKFQTVSEIVVPPIDFKSS
jgi:hypothetical protein